jgi:hypothetical protein
MSKARRDYWVDAAIGAAFLVSELSALAFLVQSGWIDFSISTTPTLLGLDYGLWQSLHKYGGIAMMVGVVAHLLLHSKWIVAMTGKVFSGLKLPGRKRDKAATIQAGQ